MSNNANFIKVDKDGDCIMVYMVPEDSQPARYFWRDEYSSAADWKFSAERYATAQAVEQGCEFGCNY